MKTFSRKLTALSALALVAVSMLLPGPAALASSAPLASIHGGRVPLAAIGPNEVFKITFTTAKCWETNESTDEIYVIFAVVRPGGLFGTPGLDMYSTHVHNGIDDGDTFTSNTPVLWRHVDSDVAVVALVIEHDSTSTSDVKALVRLNAQVAFATAIQGGQTDVWTLSGLVGTAMEGAVAMAARPFVDDDDRIGSAQRFLVTTETFDDLTVGGPSSFVSRNARGAGASYQLYFEIERTN